MLVGLTWHVQAKFLLILGVEHSLTNLLIFLEGGTVQYVLIIHSFNQCFTFSLRYLSLSPPYILVFFPLRCFPQSPPCVSLLSSLFKLCLVLFLLFMSIICHPQPTHNFPVPECAMFWESWCWRKRPVSVWVQDMSWDCSLLVWAGYWGQRLDWRMDKRRVCHLPGGHHLGPSTTSTVQSMHSDCWTTSALWKEMNGDLL